MMQEKQAEFHYVVLRASNVVHSSLASVLADDQMYKQNHNNLHFVVLTTLDTKCCPLHVSISILAFFRRNVGSVSRLNQNNEVIKIQITNMIKT
jgi:hypothetical protein